MVQSTHSWCTEELSGSFLLEVKCWYLEKMYHSVFHIKGKKEILPENILYTSRDLRGARSVVWLHLSRSDQREWNNERRKGAICLNFALILISGFAPSQVLRTPPGIYNISQRLLLSSLQKIFLPSFFSSCMLTSSILCCFGRRGKVGTFSQFYRHSNI